MEGGCAQRGILGCTPSTAPASTTIVSTAASRNCGDKARGEPRVGVWTLPSSQIPLPLGLGLPGWPHMGGRRGKEQALCLCLPQAKAPQRTMPGPETAMLLLATATAE